MVTQAVGWLGRATWLANHQPGRFPRDSVASKSAAMWTKMKKHLVTCPSTANNWKVRNISSGGHQLVQVANGWKCMVCRTKGRLRSIGHLRCKGSIVDEWVAKVVTQSGEQSLSHAKHQLMRTGSVYWCNKCGAYAEDKAYGLAKLCSGHITGILGGGRLQQLIKLRKGMHPKSGAFIGTPVPEVSWDGEEPVSQVEKAKTPVTAGSQQILAVQQRVRQRLGLSPSSESSQTQSSKSSLCTGSSCPPSVSKFEALRLRIKAKEVKATGEVHDSG